MAPRKVVVVANASGSGKTTFARALAERIGAPHVELDALVHGPGWVECSDDELRARVTPLLAGPAWVIDGVYRRKLGDLVLAAADEIVWLDLPLRVWFPRLVARTIRRVRGLEPLWNGNRETLRTAVWGRDSLFGYALRNYRRNHRLWGELAAHYPIVRLSSPRAVDAYLARAGR